MCERAEEVVIEQSLSDMKFFTENEGKLGLNNYLMSPWILYVQYIIQKKDQGMNIIF